VYRGTVRHSDIKKRLGEVCVLRHAEHRFLKFSFFYLVFLLLRLRLLLLLLLFLLILLFLLLILLLPTTVAGALMCHAV
jgi:hypothetical protein